MEKSTNYKRQKLIGEGSYGKVYDGLKIDTEEHVALKVIPKIAHSEQELSVLRLECDIHSRLNHNNIIKMLEYYDDEKELVLITERAKCSLADLIFSEGRPKTDQVQRIACDITSALFYLHSERILHRDLKPQNVLIGYDGLAKVCDFGLAKAMNIDTFLLTSVKGTPIYMAPEIIARNPYDYKADLWSFGCILYELMVGVPPFNANEIFQLVKMMEEPIKWNGRINGDCCSFLQRLLEKKPERRMGWPDLLDHPYIVHGVCVDREVGKFALTKALSPSQEIAKETQRHNIQKKPTNHHRFERFQPSIPKKVVQKYHGKGTHPYIQSPTSNLIMVQHGQIAALYNPFHENSNPNLIPDNETTDEITQSLKVDGENNVLNNLKYREEDSDSSVDTMSSSSSDDSEDERATVVVESKSSGKSHCSNGGNKRNQNKIPRDSWISGTRLAYERPIQEDPEAVDEEWLAYLSKNIKEVIRNPGSLCEKYSFRLIVLPLRNHLTGVVVVGKIALLLSLPFAVEGSKDAKLIKNLENLYLESKVVANLIYACKLIVIRRKLESESIELEEIPNILMEEDLETMDKCLRLVCYLIHSEERFVVQLCDSILGFQAYVLFQLFLRLDMKRTRLTIDTLAILCHLMRTLPGNVSILEDIFLGEDDGKELWRLLANTNSVIQSITLRIFGYLVIHSANTREKFVYTNSAKLWRTLRSASTQPDSKIVSAAQFAAENVRYLETPNILNRPIQPTSLP